MKVLNVHQRDLARTPEKVGALIDSLSSAKDALWPRQSRPRMELDRPLDVGAVGGHGPIRYVVEEYTPGETMLVAGAFFAVWPGVALWMRARRRAGSRPPPQWVRSLLVCVGLAYLLGVFLLIAG